MPACLTGVSQVDSILPAQCSQAGPASGTKEEHLNSVLLFLQQNQPLSHIFPIFDVLKFGFSFCFVRFTMKSIAIIHSILLLFLLFAETAKGQALQPQRSIELTETPAAFSVDAFGAVYILQQNGSFIKYDSLGNAVALPGRKTSSSLWSIDTQNPYKIILFNRDLQQADMFNASFSKINSYNLSNIDAGDISLFCNSFNNGFWAFTSQNGNLIRFSEQWDIVSQTNTTTLIDEEGFLPDILIENEQKLLLAQRSGTAYLFDVFGNMLLRFPDKATNYAMENDILYFLVNDSIHAYQTVFHEETIVPFGLSSMSDFAFSSPWFAILSENKIFLFRKP